MESMELPPLYEAIRALELKLKAEELLEHAFLVSGMNELKFVV